MLYTILEKNSFGGITKVIEFNPLFHLHIDETDKNGVYLIALKELKFFRKKERLSFLVHGTFEEVVKEGFERIYGYIINNTDIVYSKDIENRIVNEIIAVSRKKWS